MEVARPGRGVRPRYAVRVPPGRSHATEKVNGRRLPVGPAAIGPVEAKERIDVRPRLVRLAVEVEACVGPIDHRRVAITRGCPRQQDRHVAEHEGRLVEEAHEDAEPRHAGATRSAIVLLHATEVGSVGGPGGVAPHGAETVLGGRLAATGHEPQLAVGRLIGRPGTATSEKPAAVEAETAMPVELIPEAAELVPVRLT